MTLSEFIKKYKNGVDFDGMYGKQCVDYVNAYARDVLGIKNAFVGPQYAYQCFTDYAKYPNIKNNFNRVANSTKTLNFPSKGDVIVWAKERNGYAGHIAIVLEAGEHTFTVAEQNYDGKGSVRTYTYLNYNNVLGWLVPKSKKVNEPAVKSGQAVKLKKRAKLFSSFTSQSEAVKLGSFSKFDGEAILKVGATVVAGKVKKKMNGNIWAYIEKYGGWICVYDYEKDISKI